MYNRTAINDFVNFIQGKNGISDKSALIDDVQKKYNLTKKEVYFIVMILQFVSALLQTEISAIQFFLFPLYRNMTKFHLLFVLLHLQKIT